MRRRALLAGSAAVAGGAAVGAGAARAVGSPPADTAPATHGTDTIAFHGPHQAGIEMSDPQAHQSLIALDLADGVDADGIHRLLGLLTDDAARLTAGRPALADQERELTATPARLTVTFGFGAGLVERVLGRAAVPDWLAPLPAYSIDRLQERWSGGDLALQVASDDPTTLAHTVKVLVRDSIAFASVRWHQAGFRHAAGAQPPGTTARNLFGQVDGTANVPAGTPDFDDVVWRSGGSDWLDGGTTMVVRRIAMDQTRWEKVDRVGRENVIGRRLTDGAPLTGHHEHDVPDLDAKDEHGFTVITPYAHVRRARMGGDTQRIVRRAYNYDLGPSGTTASDGGLVFTAFQRDLEAQFLPIQARLAELDMLNDWTTPIGSAVFAVPGGVASGQVVGARMFA